MARIIVLIFRMMPLEIVIGVVAVVAYLALSNKKGTSVAKEVLIKIVLFINVVLFTAFLLVTLYSILDHHAAMIELSGSCAGICGLSALIALVCKKAFLKNRPNYNWKRVDFKKVFNRDNSKIR